MALTKTPDLMVLCRNCVEDYSAFERTGRHWKDVTCDSCGHANTACIEVANAVPFSPEEMRKRPTRERPIKLKEIAAADRPLSERRRLISAEWVKADGAARILEELKTTELETRKARLLVEQGDMPDNRAERMVKSDPLWREYIETMCNARTYANQLRQEMVALDYEHDERVSREANMRHEARLSRG